MESPFFRTQSRPRYASTFREPPSPAMAARHSPRVVSIPVHFVGSKRSRADSALKIQKIFRAFMVRKSVRKIAAIKREVDEVERRMSRRETVEAIRSDAKERLRVNETLMSLLLKLDSVRGIDSGVRDCRKAVIKKAIGLQERIDTIVAGDHAIGVESVPEGPESESEEPVVDPNSKLSDFDSVQTLTEEGKPTEQSLEDEPMPNSSDSEDEEPAMSQGEAIDFAPKAESETGVEEAPVEAASEENSIGDSESESELQSSASPLSTAEGKGSPGGRRSEELMERMAEDNEKLMGLMTSLHERSAEQTQLLNSLTQRVEQLERAFVCDKMRRKKKKQRRDCPAKKCESRL